MSDHAFQQSGIEQAVSGLPSEAIPGSVSLAETAEAVVATHNEGCNRCARLHDCDRASVAWPAECPQIVSIEDQWALL